MERPKQTEEHIKKRIESRRRNGFWKNPEESLKKLKQIQFKKGHTPWNKGKTYTYEEIYGEEKAKLLRDTMRLSRLGRTHSKETREKISKNNSRYNLGKHLSIEHRHKISEGNKGRVGYFRGKKLSKEHKEKLIQSLIGKKQSIETIEKRTKKLKGRKLSKEVKEKISFATKIAMQRPEIQEKIKHTWFKKGHQSDTQFKEGQMALDKHHNWKGGISFESYTLDFNDRFKEAIRERDNRCCIICNRPEEELGQKLSIHHIDYNKKNAFPQNCVSLCRSHHNDTNYNRDIWKTFFQSLLAERYSYEYTQDQKIILDFIKGDIE